MTTVVYPPRNRTASPLWRNWSGSVVAAPAHLIRVTAEEDVVRAVQIAAQRGLGVRAAGTGHSFNRIVDTSGVLLDLSTFDGVLEVRPDEPSVTVHPGTLLRDVCSTVARHGLALPNIGTLAEQTVGGAISTGNHGTGTRFAPLAADVTALRIVTADGQVRDLSVASTPELLRHARTALGALGVITAVTLRCVPAFTLRVSRRSLGFDEVVDDVESWACAADHVALSWLPWQDRMAARLLWRETAVAVRPRRLRQYATTLSEIGCGLVGLAGTILPSAVPALTGLLPGGPSGDYTDDSVRVFTFPQPVRFFPVEYAVDRTELPAALSELRTALRRHGWHTPYALLVRVGAGDDTSLSPAYGRDTAYLNVTVPRAQGYRPTLRLVERIMLGAGGRPHWAKLHSAAADTLAPRYPRWAAFQEARTELDPDGMFLNDHLRRVLGAQ
ncbi:D-arabinono-1,4-lactone oxidase [Micromonospora sp. NPDC005171]|uniref:D-arabinono-1,4-lactone oxidase n=1 Tax=Micromonospora sp. NPDC005171 TaxID=3156866 RepID=UPI0033BF826B